MIHGLIFQAPKLSTNANFSVGKISLSSKIPGRIDPRSIQIFPTFIIKQQISANLSSFMLNRMCVCAQLCPAPCNPVDRSPPGSSVHGIFQARILEWGVISLSRGSSQARDRTCVFCTGRWILQHYTTRVIFSPESYTLFVTHHESTFVIPSSAHFVDTAIAVSLGSMTIQVAAEMGRRVSDIITAMAQVSFCTPRISTHSVL